MGRYEYKYQIDRETYLRIRPMLATIMERDPFSNQAGRYLVDSIYFDTPDLEFLRQKIEGDYQHIKIRLRSYGDRHSGGPCFWEAKLKWNHWQKKFRSPAASADLSQASIKDCPLLPELTTKLSLEPQCSVTYWREAYVAPGLRLNFDYDLTVARERQDRPVPIISSEQLIFELKANDNELPEWLQNVIAKEGLVQTSFSKYVYGLSRLGF